MRKRLVRVGIWAGAVCTAIRTVIWWLGDIQTLQQLAEDRLTIAGLIATVLLNPWLGPAIVVFSLAIYLYLEYWPEKDESFPFAVAVPEMSTGQGEIQFHLIILNRQPAARLTLDLSLDLVDSQGRRYGNHQPKLDEVSLSLGPQERTDGMVTFSWRDRISRCQSMTIVYSASTMLSPGAWQK